MSQRKRDDKIDCVGYKTKQQPYCSSLTISGLSCKRCKFQQNICTYADFKEFSKLSIKPNKHKINFCTENKWHNLKN